MAYFTYMMIDFDGKLVGNYTGRSMDPSWGIEVPLDGDPANDQDPYNIKIPFWALRLATPPSVKIFHRELLFEGRLLWYTQSST